MSLTYGTLDGTVFGTSPCTLKTEKQLNTPSTGFGDIAAFDKIGASKGSVLVEDTALASEELVAVVDSVGQALGFAVALAEFSLGLELPTFRP